MHLLTKQNTSTTTFSPEKTFRKKLLISSICLMLAACNSSNNNNSVPTTTPPPTPSPGPVTTPATPEIEVDSQLDLDFTLRLSEMGVTPGVLSGATFDPIREEFVIVSEEGNLVFLNQEGNITEEISIQSTDEASFTGIEFRQEGEYLLSTSDSKVQLLEIEGTGLDVIELEPLAELEFDIAAIAWDEVSSSALVIDNRSPGRIVSILADGSTTETELEFSLSDYSVEGLTVFEDNLLIAAVAADGQDTENQGTLIIAADLMGEFGPVWGINSTQTSGLVLLNPETPEFLTTNADEQQSVTLYEAALPPSVATDPLLTLSATPELEFNQPSGIDFAPQSNELFYVTDFGEVRRGNTDGDNELLFEFDEMQGSFEAIAADPENQNLYVMFSDDATEQSTILTLDFQGNQTAALDIEVTNPEHLFESIDFNIQNNSLYTMSSTEGSKVLYAFNDGQTTTTTLPEIYDDFLISGIAISEDASSLYFVTEEWDNPATGLLSAGLLVKFDLINQSESARYSLAIAVEGEGETEEEVQGIRDPSGIAINGDETMVYITPDIDDSVLYVFELD